MHKIISRTIVYYPQTSPVGIVSICDPATDQLLLIRQPRYPPGMYSCIAGFLDVGEPLEDCVRREAAEEVGIEVDKVRIFVSIIISVKLSQNKNSQDYLYPYLYQRERRNIKT